MTSRADTFILDGEPRRDIEPGVLFGRFFIYESIHISDSRPLHLAGHLQLLNDSSRVLYGKSSGLTAERIAGCVKELWVENRYQGSVVMYLALFQPEGRSGNPQWALIVDKPLLYKGYSLWHKGLSTTSANIVQTFPYHRTSTGLTAWKYARLYALNRGKDQSLVCNGQTILCVAGDPVFAVKGNSLLTPPLSAGIADSVHRRLVFELCRRKNIDIAERGLTLSDLKKYDEFFTVDTQGITSISSVDGISYPNTGAKRIAGMLGEFVPCELTEE